jgi:aminoglycoside phosphotransferase (APT) family kinase protein
VDLRHPPAEVHVDVDLAAALVAAQHPHFMTGPVSLVDEGWDNFTYRVGSEYAVRIPRRRVAVDLLLNEQKWLPVVAPWLPVAVPLPVGLGVPSDLFPWPWSVVVWIPGTTAEDAPLAPEQATHFADTLRALHRTAPDDAPFNPFRGVPLETRRDVVEERLARLDLRDLAVLWRRALEAAPAEDAVWLHGDLHPRNVLVRDGALAGVIDWGDMTAGDVATDLACAWMLFDARGRAAFWDAYAPTEQERLRAMGWAVNFASALVDSGEPRHVRMGHFILHQLVGSH